MARCAAAHLGSWELPAPRGYLKFVYAECYPGKGLYGNGKRHKREYLGTAGLEQLGDICDALVLGSGCIYDNERILIGRVDNIRTIAGMVGQGCAVYLWA